MNRFLGYLRRNWGAPFIAAFILLLFISAVELSIAATGPANDIAVYAFYSLVVGVGLQIASYVKYGSKEEEAPKEPVRPPRPPMFSQRTRKVLAILSVIVIVAAVGATAYAYTSSHGFNSLTVTVNYVNALKEPGGVVVVAFAVTASGGTPPYNYSAVWPDGVTQVSTGGGFIRTFVNQTIPGSVAITVTSSDGQKVTKSATIPAPSSSSASTSTSSSSTSGSSATLSTSTSTGKFPPLAVIGNFTDEYVEPGGNTTVTFGVSVRGGELPFNFVAVWSDGTVQSNTLGTFSRTFTSGEVIPTSAQVTVISGDDQKVVVTLTISSNGS